MGEKVMEGQRGGLKHSKSWISKNVGFFVFVFNRKNLFFKQILRLTPNFQNR